MMAAVNNCSRVDSQQKGFVLVVTLIFVVIISLIVIGISGTTMSEEKIARNFQDKDFAYHAAEAALRDAELYLTGSWRLPYQPVNINSFNDTCASGLCDSMITQTWQPIDQVDFFGASAPGNNSVRLGTVTGSPTIAGIVTASQPRYLIEMVPTKLGSLTAATPNRVFRITAQARGRLATTRIVLQEVYVMQDYVK